MYTTILFSWQWILSFPDKKIFFGSEIQSLIHSSKPTMLHTSPSIATGLAYCYSYGLYKILQLQQMFRAILEITFSLYAFLLLCLVMLKSYLGITLYRRKSLDYLEMASYFNLLFFTMASFYSLGNRQSQKKAAYVSVSVAFISSWGS